MQEEEVKKPFGERAKHECNQLFCKPKARCFKGLAILSGIYVLACLGMLLIIPPVFKSHGCPIDPEGDEDCDKVHDRLHEMKISTGILAVVFAGIVVLNLILCKFFDSKEKRHRDIVSGNMMANDQFREDENDFEER